MPRSEERSLIQITKGRFAPAKSPSIETQVVAAVARNCSTNKGYNSSPLLAVRLQLQATVATI